MDQASSFLLFFLRKALGFEGQELDVMGMGKDDWEKTIELAFDHGVDAISVDGYQKYLSDHPGVNTLICDEVFEDLRYDWFASILQVEQEYHEYSKSVEQLCAIYSKNGFKPILLKGLGLGMNYPIPAHRPIGDIDIFLGAEHCLAGDVVIRDKLQIPVTKAKFSHHSHFIYKGFSVENHYELGHTYFGGHRSRRKEEIFRELISNGLWKPYEGCSYYLPSSNFNAVFLIYHLGAHFSPNLISFRQLCDWVMFLKNHHAEIDWPLVKRAWKDNGMDKFAHAICSVGVKYFGMPETWLPGLQYDEKIADRIVKDILAGEKRSKHLICRVFQYFRYAWKYKLTSGSSWIIIMLESAWLHLFHAEDMKEKDI